MGLPALSRQFSEEYASTTGSDLITGLLVGKERDIFIVIVWLLISARQGGNFLFWEAKLSTKPLRYVGWLIQT